MAASVFSPEATLLQLLLPQHTAKKTREERIRRKEKEEQKLSQTCLA